MSCLNITVTNMSPPLQVVAERLGGVILTVIKSSDSLNCNIFDKLINKHLKLTCGIVCTIADYPPSLATASLYEAIDKEHSGEADDPIPYAPPMEIFKGKYYIEDGVAYKCTRDSGVALTHKLSALVGLYVEVA